MTRGAHIVGFPGLQVPKWHRSSLLTGKDRWLLNLRNHTALGRIDQNLNWLVVYHGIPTPLKNVSSPMGTIIPYMKWKIKNV